MTRTEDLVPRAREVLIGKKSIKARQLARLLTISSHQASNILQRLPEWKKGANTHTWQRIAPENDITMISKRIVISLTGDQYTFLKAQKQKSGLSYASQIRSMITQHIERTNLQYLVPQSSTATRTAKNLTERSFMKSPDAANISALNLELKALFKSKQHQREN